VTRGAGAAARIKRPGQARRGLILAALLLIAVLYLLLGCTANGVPEALREAGPTRPVWLVAPGWHTGLLIRRADIPPERLPERADFPDAEYLEFGWGDRDYYQAPEFDLWITLKAALVPTPGVLHVAGFQTHPAGHFAPDDVLRIDLPEPRFRRLLDYVHASFARRGAARLPPLAPGLYGHSHFYAAAGEFHLFNTCNSWIAGALKAAGLPVSPRRALTARGLLCQVRHWGAAEPLGAGVR
jgi:uncharacterized protein (TIGR02117 family)